MIRNPSVIRRVLVVDDHPASRQFTVAALRQTGCSVKQAASVRETAAHLHSWWPDAILSDWQLGDGNGSDVASLVSKSIPSGGSLPRMVMLTGEISGEANPYALHGFERVLVKPCRAGELAAALGLQAAHAIQENSNGQTELANIIHAEFQQRLPELEKLISQRQFRSVHEITHQLVASSAFSGNRRLHAAVAALHHAVGNRPDAATIAACWCKTSAAAEDFLHDA